MKAEIQKGISLWSDTVRMREWSRLEGVQGCDVLVIGGGMAGVLTASRLHRQGVDVILVDGHRLGSGVTAGTTAKVTSQHGLVYQKLITDIGTEKARMYLDVNESAVGEYAELCSSGDSCGFQRKSNLIYSRSGASILEKEMKALEMLNYPARLRTNLPLPFETDGAVEFPVQACIHPLQLIRRIAEEDCQSEEKHRGLRIFENSRITRLRRWKDGGWEAAADHGTVLADQGVVTSHFPFLDRRGLYFAKMHQCKSLVIAGQAPQREPLDGMYMDEAEGGWSFREADNLLLIGGGSGRPGQEGITWNDMERATVTFYPGWETEYCWSAQDCMTLDGLPYIGPYYGSLHEEVQDEKVPGLWTASGFNKWGMTGSMVSAMILSDLICGRKNPYSSLFQPGRSMLKPQLFANAAESAKNLLKPKVPRCRHLGCALHWNDDEKTWDCSCHGSRYDHAGRCLEGPSTKDLL